MRVSLTARYVSHPTIEFGSRRLGGRRHRLGLTRSGTVFHRPGGARGAAPNVVALRSLTSRFSFPTLGRPGRILEHRVARTPGTPRVRRA